MCVCVFTSVDLIGADFHTAAVATAPGEKLLIGRHAVEVRERMAGEGEGPLQASHKLNPALAGDAYAWYKPSNWTELNGTQFGGYYYYYTTAARRRRRAPGRHCAGRRSSRVGRRSDGTRRAASRGRDTARRATAGRATSSVGSGEPRPADRRTRTGPRRAGPGRRRAAQGSGRRARARSTRTTRARRTRPPRPARRDTRRAGESVSQSTLSVTNWRDGRPSGHAPRRLAAGSNGSSQCRQRGRRAPAAGSSRRGHGGTRGDSSATTGGSASACDGAGGAVV